MASLRNSYTTPWKFLIKFCQVTFTNFLYKHKINCFKGSCEKPTFFQALVFLVQTKDIPFASEAALHSVLLIPLFCEYICFKMIINDENK